MNRLLELRQADRAAYQARERALRQQIARVIAGLFDGYQSGMDAEAEPPLLTYQKEEAHIKQREL